MAHHTFNLSPGDTITIVAETQNNVKNHSVAIIKLQAKYPELWVLFDYMQFLPELLFGRTRKTKYVLARFYIAYVLKNKYNLENNEIANILNRDRTSILYYLQQHIDLIETQFEKYLEFINEIEISLHLYEEDKA